MTHNVFDTHRVFAIDPSLTCTGWAMMDGDVGVIAHGTAVPHGGTTQERIDELCGDLTDLAQEHRPHAIVIETPAENMRGGRNRAVTSGAAYGFCVGQVYRALQDAISGCTIVGTPATEWTKSLGHAVRATRGDQYKLNRVRAVEYLIPYMKGHLGVKTKAGNVADAILIGRWYFGTRFKVTETDRRTA